jgi:hypothetical protein
MTSQLLSPKETAKRLGLKNAGTLNQWRFHHRYPLRFVRIGSRIMYREEDVQNFIELRTSSGTGEAQQPVGNRRGRRKRDSS